MTLEYQVAALHADILYCDGKEWPEMFARMDTGLMAAQTGLAVHMGQLGLLLECTTTLLELCSGALLARIMHTIG